MRKRLLIGIIFISVFLSTNVVSAQSLSYMETNVDVNWESLTFNTNIIFNEMPERFSYPIFYDIEEFKSSANFNNFQCKVEEKKWGNEIICDLSSVEGRGKTLKWSYKTESVLSDVENKKMADFEIKIPFETEKAVFRTTLSEGLILTKENETSSLVPYTPRNGTKGSNGRQIYVYWVKENLPKGEDFGISLIYETVGPTNNGTDNTFLILLIGSVLAVFILIFFILKGEKKGVELSVLKEDEREAYEIIKKYGGECKQKRIVSETEYSKAKVSRMIKNLKERGLVEVERIGRSNRVKTKKDENKD
ncbi:MAG: helix-turn-helix transcriptional regulator [Candidatus Aenigmatarchaeota archaeon]